MSWLLEKKKILARGNSYIKATIDIDMVSDLAYGYYCSSQ